MSDFKTQAEIWQYLLDGGKVRPIGENAKYYLHLKDGELVNNVGDKCNYTSVCAEDWQKYHEPQWYENIPEQGVLCWVADVEEDWPQGIAAIITRCQDTLKFSFRSASNTGWRYAKPLTKEEALQLCLGEEE